MGNLKQSYEHIDGQGIEKVVSMIRLALQEAPRLQEALASEDLKKRESARLETAFLLESIDFEILRIEKQSGQRQATTWNRLRQEGFFNEEELKALEHYLQFIERHRQEIFEKPASVKNTQPTQSKKLKFKA